MTAADDREALREKAQTARRLALEIGDAMAAKNLMSYATRLEAQADRIQAVDVLSAAAAIPSGEPPLAHAAAALKPEILLEAEASDGSDPKP